MVTIAVEDDARPHEVIEDVFLGKTGPMTFRVPKVGMLLSALITSGDGDEAANDWIRAQLKWLRAGFSPQDWAVIVDRLDDPDDALTLSHLRDLYGALQEATGSRPTTSSNGSTPTPSGTGTEGAPRPSTSTSGDSDRDGLPI